MAISAEIQDGASTGVRARVSQWGTLAAGPLDFSLAYSAEVDTINTAFVLVPPQSGKRFILSTILLYANKNVGAGDATVTIYEADTADTTTADRVVLETEMLKQTSRDLVGLNMIVSKGKWLSIKTDDNTIFATAMGYYVPVDD